MLASKRVLVLWSRQFGVPHLTQTNTRQCPSKTVRLPPEFWVVNRDHKLYFEKHPCLGFRRFCCWSIQTNLRAFCWSQQIRMRHTWPFKVLSKFSSRHCLRKRLTFRRLVVIEDIMMYLYHHNFLSLLLLLNRCQSSNLLPWSGAFLTRLYAECSVQTQCTTSVADICSFWM